ncbi:hypothetical protein AZZ89_002876, partial [Enterobacter hormaechei]
MCWHVRAIRKAILCSHNLSRFTCRPGKHQRHRAFCPCRPAHLPLEPL